MKIEKFEYNKIQNYLQAIIIISEHGKTAEHDAAGQLAIDLSNYISRFNPEPSNDEEF